MKTNIVEAVKLCFTSKVIHQLSLSVDESTLGVERGLEKAIPLVLESLLLHTERTGGPESLLNLVRGAYAANLVPHLPQLQTTAWYAGGVGLMPGLTGDGYHGLVNRITVAARIRHLAGETLLSVAAAAALSVLGKHDAENELSPAEFVSWFQMQKAEVTMALFPDMNRRLPASDNRPETLSPAFLAPRSAPVARRAGPAGQGIWATVGGGATFTPPSETSFSPPDAPGSAAGFRWQWPLLLLLAVGLGYYFGHDRLTTLSGSAATFADSSGGSPTSVANSLAASTANLKGPSGTTARGTYDKVRDTYIYDTGQPIILTLADGSTQKVGANSTENRLYTFLVNSDNQVDSVNRTKGWINFDRVYFDAGKATLTPESEQQLHNIARVLQTFPAAVVKLGGYTDSTGNSLQNLLLSEERAKIAMLALAKHGVSPDRLQTKGYGAKYFITSNATLEGRALNRRISIRVVKK